MSRYHSYINTAAGILQRYTGQEPLAAYLKKFFAANKKYGSKDRKQISHLCYCYFRLGKAMPGEEIEKKILTALFLCSNASNELLQQLAPKLNEKINLSLAEKFQLPGISFSPEQVFPWMDELSEDVDAEKFSQSFLIQPDLFLRLRPGKEKTVQQKLEKAAIAFTIVNDTCIAMPNASRIDEIIQLNKEAVVQDMNSQRVGGMLSIANNHLPIASAWDCCAASGGKSVMLHDLNPKIRLTVSDIRESIISNLKKRFKEADISNYHSFVADLTNARSPVPDSSFDLIIADVPCSGSGTWSRTPEQLYFFQPGKINEYAALQKKIVTNAIPALKPGGYFLYITCSVFKKENEEMVKFILQHSKLQLVEKQLLKGYEQKADSMFAALFRANI